jgi:hypothetical protein
VKEEANADHDKAYERFIRVRLVYVVLLVLLGQCSVV